MYTLLVISDCIILTIGTILLIMSIVKCDTKIAADYIYSISCQLKKYLPNKRIIFIPSKFEIESWGNDEFSEYIENLIKARKGE